SREGDGGPAPAIKNLDRLPFPLFTAFPMELYTDQTRIPMAASRGCVWACHFCSTHSFWPGYSYMSGDRIFAEVEHHKSVFPHRAHFEFYDIAANGKPETLERFSELAAAFIDVGRPEKNFRWKINAVIRPEMTAALLKKMYNGGCQDIIYGIESASPRVLKSMNKHFRVEVAERVLRDTHEAGIRAIANFMFGFPGETEEDFQQTLDFLRRNSSWLDRAYGSATFTSLEEHSYLADHPAEFDIRPDRTETFHNLYWENHGGDNTYPVRLDRYKRFRWLCKELDIDAYKGVDGNLEQDHLSNLAHFHQYKDNRMEAIRTYLQYLEKDLLNAPILEQLKGYQRDLHRLVKAQSLLDRLNQSLEQLNGYSEKLWARYKDDLEKRVPLAMPVGGDSEARVVSAQRYLIRAHRHVLRLDHPGGLRFEEGRYRIVWEKEFLPSFRELAYLKERTDLVLFLADKESRRTSRGESSCAR
ncbi:MAG TPA: radical SAM protein, partial [Elusimicrobiota bacterium]|nr:radical SAM protein [Elusimicrobiota bacterium]